jgi:hypothetical protein
VTTLLRLEEFGVFLFSIYLFTLLPYRWWLFPLLLLTPDLSMFGYAFGPAIGAITYNLVHHRLVALALIVLGTLLHGPVVALAGVILLAHASIDRALGFGLKHQDAFSHTHLDGSAGQARHREAIRRRRGPIRDK